jgi:hypothetical protein
MPKSKLSAIVSLLLVFLSGALVGAMAHRLYMVNTVLSSKQLPPPRRDPEEVRRQLVAETRDRVKLDDEQVRKLDQFYDDERAQFGKLRQGWNEQGRDLRAITAEKIKGMLRPDQLPLFEQLQADREKEHRRRQQQNEKK